MRRTLLIESAMPRSKPSNNVQALHNGLLDICPHRWHVSVSFNENKMKVSKMNIEGNVAVRPTLNLLCSLDLFFYLKSLP